MVTERQPHHAVRMLGALQERIAHGDEAAVALQQAVVIEIAQELKIVSARRFGSPFAIARR